jgi:hypothetical protein
MKRDLKGLQRLVVFREPHLAQLERSLCQRRGIESLHIVEEIAGLGGMRLYRGRFEAKVRIVGQDVFVDILLPDCNRNGQTQRQAGSGSRFVSKHAALQVIVGGRVDRRVIARDEVNARIVEQDRIVGVVGDDYPDRHHLMAEIIEPCVRPRIFDIPRLGRNGHMLQRMSLVHGIILGIERRLGFTASLSLADR